MTSKTVGTKRNLIFTEEYFLESYSCMEKKYKSNQLNESQLTLFYQSWNYLQKIKVDVFVERHLTITKNLFILDKRKFDEII